MCDCEWFQYFGTLCLTCLELEAEEEDRSAQMYADAQFYNMVYLDDDFIE